MSNLNIKLVICESTTGIVLNRDLKYFDSAKHGDKKQLLFNTIEDAKRFISENHIPNISFEVFDQFGDLIYEEHIPPKKIF